MKMFHRLSVELKDLDDLIYFFSQKNSSSFLLNTKIQQKVKKRNDGHFERMIRHFSGFSQQLQTLNSITSIVMNACANSLSQLSIRWLCMFRAKKQCD